MKDDRFIDEAEGPKAPKRSLGEGYDFIELAIITIALGPFVSMALLSLAGFVLWCFGVLP